MSVSENTDTDIGPVITIDGPGGSGKGTVSLIVARSLGWNFLDSGAFYRLVALAAGRRGVQLSDESALASLALQLDVRFCAVDQSGFASDSGFIEHEIRIMLDSHDVSHSLRTQECANAASQIATLPQVRLALLDKQRAFRTTQGLVADGRDMGSVVFPDAALKIYLTASAQARAMRRYKQLINKGMSANILTLEKEIAQRDARDSGREIAPMKPDERAILIDSTSLSIEEVVQCILSLWQNTLPK